MNLNQLRYVKTVTETGSFTLAAERCYVTQPTLSNGIAQLEEEFEEPLCFIPRSTKRPEGTGTIRFKDIAEETFVRVPDGCDLARATRALFRSHRQKLNEYPGEALSYQVLEEWASLELREAMLPKSKRRSSGRKASLLTDKKSRKITFGC